MCRRLLNTIDQIRESNAKALPEGPAKERAKAAQPIIMDGVRLWRTLLEQGLDFEDLSTPEETV